MKLAMIGLGKMGANMVRRLVKDGHELIAFDVDTNSSTALADELDDVTAVSTLNELIQSLPAPRVVCPWPSPVHPTAGPPGRQTDSLDLDYGLP